MGYLITQILFCLVIAALIGLVIGWLLRHLVCRKRMQSLETDWAARLSRVQADRDELAERLASPQHETVTESEEPLESGTMPNTGVAPEQSEYGIRKLKPGLKEPVKPRLLSAPQGEPDDLKQISGVGRTVEKKLNKLGIYHFHQIADFAAEHIAWVDEYLVFRGRIQREGWVEQAKELAAGHQTEFSRRYLAKKEK